MTKTRSHHGKWFMLLLAVLIPSLLFLVNGKTRAALLEDKQKGMSYAAWSPGAYSSSDSDQSLFELRQDGVDWISLIVTRYQDNTASTTIDPSSANASDDDLVHVINQAHSLGMKVMLKPHLDLANDPTHWRGDIGVGFSEADWKAWFTSYKAFINHYAQLAQANGADQFCIGTELASTEFRAADWQAVIGGVRGILTGPITYAANQGSEGAITWWDLVDYIGVDAYYPLTSKNNPTLAELEAVWAPRVAALKTLSENWEKRVIFTEIGYRSQDGANQHPWDFLVSSTIDLQEQADLYQAVFESFFNQSWFAGIFWWSWDPDPNQGGPCDMSYSPHDKPAEDILRRWYGAPPKPTEAIPGLETTRTRVVYTDTLGTGWDSWSWAGTYDFASTEQVASGTFAIKAEAQAYGAVALHHVNFSSTPYYWLELYLYKSTDASSVVVWFNDENDQNLPNRPVEDCRYTGGQPITHGVWTRVLIPLKDLKADNRRLQRLSIGNGRDQPFTFYVDDIRLVGAKWTTFVPLSLKP